MQHVFEQISLRGLLFFFEFQTQKVIQECTHQRYCSKLNQSRSFTANGGLHHISTKLKFKSQGNPSAKCQTSGS